MTRAMDLKGHKAAVYCCAFSKDSTRLNKLNNNSSSIFLNFAFV